jgi:xanthine/CO dehydrogenase XdhC/CoxF family maturation factor
MNHIYKSLAEIEATHQPAALCTMVKSSGSTPCRVVSIPLADNPELEW